MTEAEFKKRLEDFPLGQECLAAIHNGVPLAMTAMILGYGSLCGHHVPKDVLGAAVALGARREEPRPPAAKKELVLLLDEAWTCGGPK